MPKLIVLGETAYSVIFRELKKAGRVSNNIMFMDVNPGLF